MKLIRFLGIAVCSIASIGCTPLSTYYKEGTTVSRLDRDLTNCQVVAAQRVPANTQIGMTPIYTTPITTSCYGYSCTTYGGDVYGGDLYSYDANAGLRNKVTAQCMSSQGYEYVEIPACTSQQLKDKVVKTVQKLPKLTGNVCAVTRDDGTRGIVDLASL